MLSHAVWSSG